MKKTSALILFILISCLSLPALAQSPAKSAKADFAGCYCPPPRFQIFQAPKPYGGMIMVDTQSGQSWQRVIVNTPEGIRIRWVELPRVQKFPVGNETIMWD